MQNRTNQELLNRIRRARSTRIVYDHSSGKVIHTHHVVAMTGAAAPTEDDIDREAMSLASRISGRSEQEFGVLRVRFEELRSGTTYMVDLKSGTLVETSPG